MFEAVSIEVISELRELNVSASDRIVDNSCLPLVGGRRLPLSADDFDKYEDSSVMYERSSLVAVTIVVGLREPEERRFCGNVTSVSV